MSSFPSPNPVFSPLPCLLIPSPRISSTHTLPRHVRNSFSQTDSCRLSLAPRSSHLPTHPTMTCPPPPRVSSPPPPLVFSTPNIDKAFSPSSLAHYSLPFHLPMQLFSHLLTVFLFQCLRFNTFISFSTFLIPNVTISPPPENHKLF